MTGGVLSVTGLHIIPETTYAVQAVDGSDNVLSNLGLARTWQWADADNNGVINIFDLFCVTNGSGGVFNEPFTRESADMRGSSDDCQPDNNLSIVDLFAVLNAQGGSTIL